MSIFIAELIALIYVHIRLTKVLKQFEPKLYLEVNKPSIYYNLRDMALSGRIERESSDHQVHTAVKHLKLAHRYCTASFGIAITLIVLISFGFAVWFTVIQIFFSD